MTQFCESVSHAVPRMGPRQSAYPTNHTCTPSALSHHISSARTDLAARDAVDRQTALGICLPLLHAGIQRVAQPQRRIRLFIVAAKRLLDQELAELQKIRSKLPACPGQFVQRGQVDVMRQLRGNTVDRSVHARALAHRKTVCRDWQVENIRVA